MKRAPDRGALWMLSLPLVGLYLPALFWITRAFASRDSAEDTAWSSNLGELLVETTAIALGGAALAAALGAAQAILLEGFQVRGRRWLSVAFLLPFLFPAAALTTSFHYLLAKGPAAFLVQGLSGAIFLSGIQMAPVVMWGTSRAIAAIPRAEWNALRANLSPFKAALTILLPRVRGTVLRLAVLCFALLFPQLEIPGYTGMFPIGFRMLSAFTSGSDAEGLTLVAISLVVVLPLIALAIPALSSTARVPLIHERQASRSRDSSPATEIAWFMAILYTLPVLSLIGPVTTVGWSVHAAHLKGLLLELLRVIPIATIVTLMAWRLAQSPNRTAWTLFALPLLLPGSMPALALTTGLPAEWLRAIGDWPLALSLAQATRFAGIALILAHIALQSIPESERQAAALLPPNQSRWKILLPRCRPTLLTASLFLTLLMLGEVESPNLLAPPGYTIPALELHNFLHFRADENAWSLALILAASTTTLALLTKPTTNPE